MPFQCTLERCSSSVIDPDKGVVITAFTKRRSQYDVGIGYGDDIEQARALILEVLRSTEGVLQDPAPDVLTVQLADATVDLRARWWSESSRLDVLIVQDRVLTAIKNRLSGEGIDLPFPTQVVLLHDQTEETDGDRARQREGWPASSDGNPKARSTAAAIEHLATSLSTSSDGAQPPSASGSARNKS